MSLEVVFGPMFSGKSSYALSYIRRQHAIDKKVLVIKPNIDKRYTDKSVLVTHDKEETPCVLWNYGERLRVNVKMDEVDCIVFEEAQFFHGLVDTVNKLLRIHKKNILVVGLDGDANQQPFGEILQCIPLATSVTKLNALCYKCKDGTLAPFTRRVDADQQQQVDVGGSEKYESVCLKHLTYVG